VACGPMQGSVLVSGGGVVVGAYRITRTKPTRAQGTFALGGLVRDRTSPVPRSPCATARIIPPLAAPDLLLDGALCWCASPGALEARRHAMPHIRLIRDR
jgi:hypothetical protein